MRDEMEFNHDQPFQFKALDEAGGLIARYSIFDLGSGTADAVTVGDTNDKNVSTFLYYYDTTNRKSLTITCEGEVEPVAGLSYPALVETKGPNPIEFENGYVAFEDLPAAQRHIGNGGSWGVAGGSATSDDEDVEDMDIDIEEEE